MRLYLKSCGEMTGEGARPDYARPSSRLGSLALSNLEPGRAIAKRRRPRALRRLSITHLRNLFAGYPTRSAPITDRGDAFPPCLPRRNNTQGDTLQDSNHLSLITDY